MTFLLLYGQKDGKQNDTRANERYGKTSNIHPQHPNVTLWSYTQCCSCCRFYDNPVQSWQCFCNIVCLVFRNALRVAWLRVKFSECDCLSCNSEIAITLTFQGMVQYVSYGTKMRMVQVVSTRNRFQRMICYFNPKHKDRAVITGSLLLDL